MTSNQSLRDPPGRARRRVGPQVELEEPILAELFSVERLEQHAQTLAAADRITDTPREGHDMGPRIADNGRVLLESYRVLARAIKDERWITPASEWLVDNFPIVDEQLREIRDDLPPDYYRELPKLTEGHLEGYPRVLSLTWAYIAHTDSRFDPESLRRMVTVSTRASGSGEFVASQYRASDRWWGQSGWRAVSGDRLCRWDADYRLCAHSQLWAKSAS